ncbi:LysE family translocator [Eionea flava]
MTIDVWLTFIAAVLIFALIPGPTVVLVVGQAITHGKKSVLPLVAGVLCGDFVAMSLSLLGLGAVLATSATLFFLLKWFGVAYLIYLGVKTWREKPDMESVSFKGIDISSKKMFRSSFVVTALNPKGIVFFVAFLPQFVNSEAVALPQLLILMATFLMIVATTITSFALFAGLINHKIGTYQTRKRLNRVGGGALIGAGVLTSAMQRG